MKTKIFLKLSAVLMIIALCIASCAKSPVDDSGGDDTGNGGNGGDARRIQQAEHQQGDGGERRERGHQRAGRAEEEGQRGDDALLGHEAGERPVQNAGDPVGGADHRVRHQIDRREQQTAAAQLVLHHRQPVRHVGPGHAEGGDVAQAGGHKGHQRAGDQKAEHHAQMQAAPVCQKQCAGQDHQQRGHAHGARVVAQEQGGIVQCGQAAGLQGMQGGIHQLHAGNAAQRQALEQLGLRIAEDLLGPAHCHHRIPHGSGVEYITAVAAKGLLTQQHRRHRAHDYHIVAHRGGQNERQHKGKGLAAPLAFFVGLVPQPGHQTVAQVGGDHRRAAQKHRPQPVKGKGHGQQRQAHIKQICMNALILPDPGQLLFLQVLCSLRCKIWAVHRLFSPRTAAAMSALPNTALPATRRLAPAATHSGPVTASTPPSTSSQGERPRASHSARSSLSLSSALGMNFWPPKPGSTLITSTSSSRSR